MQSAQDFITRYGLCLNNCQLDAVLRKDGQYLVSAVPGSGKTTMLVARLGYLIYACDVPPENVLTLAYNVEAAKEIRRRFEGVFCRDSGTMPEFRTIHALCYHIIKHIDGVPPRIDGEDDTSDLIMHSMERACNASVSATDAERVKLMIASYRNRMMPIPDQAKLPNPKKVFQLRTIYAAYREDMAAAGMSDFDDLQERALDSLRNDSATLAWLRGRYKYICVDEAQDMSPIQHEIVLCLAGERGNVFFVGDEDQSIYSFRGASPETMVNIRDLYPNCITLQLNENFRSDTRIVNASNKLIKQNTNRFDKTAFSSRDGGEITRIRIKDFALQTDAVISLACKLSGTTAVLFRNNVSALPLMAKLNKTDIPYYHRAVSRVMFDDVSSRHALSLMQLAAVPNDIDAFLQVQKSVIGVMPYKLSDRIISAHTKDPYMPLMRWIAEYAYKTCAFSSRITKLLLKLDDAFFHAKNLPPREALMLLLKCEADTPVRYRSNVCLLKYMLALCDNYTSIESFLLELPTLSAMLSEPHEEQSKLLLSTIHSAKGLEYDNVILIDPDNDFSNKSHHNPISESERRLYFVALTRAKHNFFAIDYHRVFSVKAERFVAITDLFQAAK